MEAGQGPPDCHIDVFHSFYSMPQRLIGKKVNVRLTHWMVEIFHNHDRVAFTPPAAHAGAILP